MYQEFIKYRNLCSNIDSLASNTKSLVQIYLMKLLFLEMKSKNNLKFTAKFKYYNFYETYFISYLLFLQ